MLRLLMIIALFPAAVAAKEPEARTGDWLKKAISTAKSGAVIDIPAGDYDLTDLQISKSLKLVGDPAGGVTFRSAETTEKGILVPLAGVDLYVEKISFIGAKSWDRNGAGIRHEGRNLTVSNCRFIANEEGILATGAASGVIKLLNSEFVDNGFGDGQSHGVYVSSGDRLEVSASRFIGTRIGHHIKSRGVHACTLRHRFTEEFAQHRQSGHVTRAEKAGAQLAAVATQRVEQRGQRGIRRRLGQRQRGRPMFGGARRRRAQQRHKRRAGDGHRRHHERVAERTDAPHARLCRRWRGAAMQRRRGASLGHDIEYGLSGRIE